MLIHVIRDGNHYDFVKDFMLDNLIKSKEIVKFKRSTGWVTIGTDQIRGSKRNRVLHGTDRIEVNDSIFVREYRRATQ
jgi:hypothetical protein